MHRAILTQRAFLLMAPLALLATGARLVAADEAAATRSEPVVELPKFVVTDNRELPPPEQWRHAEIPGFEILTNTSDKTAQRLIRDFDLFKQALDLVWPMPTRGNATALLILCGKGAKFDAFVPKTGNSVETARASLFLRNREQSAIVIDMQATSLNIAGSDTADDAATGTDSTQISVDHDKQLYREYVRYLLSRSEPRVPAWLEEGIAQIIMRMQVSKREIRIGELEDPNTVSTQAGMVAAANAALGGDDGTGLQLPGAPAEDRDFNAALKRRALVPLDKFFAMPHDAPEALNPLGNNVWAKQAYAFVHMCLYGEHKRYQKAFGTFVVRSSKEPVTEALFKECFGKTYKEMLVTLRGYIDFAVYDIQGFTAKGKEPLLVDPPKLELRDATQAEVGRIKGETMVLAGYPAKAKAEFTAPYIRGERDSRLLASLGLYDKATGEDARGRKFLEAAVADKVVQPRAYLELARYRYADAIAKPGAGEQFSPEQVASISSLLLTARQQPPSLPEVYELLTDTWSHSAKLPSREDVMFLVEGVRFFPGHLRMLYQATVICAEAGVLDVAHPFADYGLRVAPDAKTRGMFEKLKAALPPAPPPPLDAAAAAAKAANPATPPTKAP
jgi:hypothetical protein